MYFRKSLTQALSVTFVMLLLTACSTPQAVPTATPTPSQLSYDYVALGDSTPAGFAVDASYVDYYAEYVESDLGVPVQVINWARDGQTANSLLRALRDNPNLRDDIGKAEIVTIWTGWNDLYGLVGEYRTGECGGTDNLDCIREEVNELNADLEGIVAEITALSDPSETLVVIANGGNHLAAQLKEAGVFEDLRGPLADDWIEPIEQLAAEYGLVFVDSYSALNGPNGDADVPADLLLQIHFNEAGHRLLADLHREAGYGPLTP